MSELYRKAALERISSPEQLDKVLEVSSPLSWPTLIGIAVLLAAVLFFWPIPVRDSVSVMGNVSPDGRQIECYLSGQDYENVKKAQDVSIVAPKAGSGAEIRCLTEILETGTQQSETTAKIRFTVAEEGIRLEPEVSGKPFRFSLVTGETSVRLISFLFG